MKFHSSKTYSDSRLAKIVLANPSRFRARLTEKITLH